jgi:integrase
MSASRLSKRTIGALKPTPGAQYVQWDTEIKGFGVRVSPAGAKTFILKYRLHTGRVRWKTIGRVDQMALEKARRHAKDDTGIVARGGDPLSDKDAARDAFTVATVGEKFLAEYVMVRKKPSTQRLYRLAIDSHITPRLGAIPIADVSHADAVKLHERLKATPILANRTIAVLSKLLSWSMTKGRYRPAGPNPCHGIEKFEERRRKRYLDAAEYNRLGQALRSAPIQPGPRTAIELLLLTGARPDEIATLQWPHVNLAGAALNLPDSKTGEKTIHLSPAAVKLLKRWPRFARSSYVFPGNARGEEKSEHMHPSTLTHAWADLRTLAGLEDVRLYDACRHSFASVAVSKHGLTLAQIGEQLGHSQPATTQRYAHLHDDVAKRNASAIGSTIAAALAKPGRRT